MSHPAGPPYPGGPPYGAPAVCVRHPDRATGLRCTRCDRPSCPECLREAAVGHQCVDCVAQGSRGVRRGVTIAGAEPGVRPLVVPVLVALNVALFAWTAAEAGSIAANYRSATFQEWALVSARLADGEWWRVLTSGFLHFGPIHLAFNMLALWFIGRDVEMVLGRSRFLAVYLVSLLGGAAAAIVIAGTPGPFAGASGAVFGLMGALVVVLRRLRMPRGPVLVLIAINLALGILVPVISVTGHLGGLVVGAAATAVLVYAPAAHRTAFQAAGLLAIVVLLVIAVAARVALVG